MADIIYNSFKRFVCSGVIQLPGDPIKCALASSVYVPSAMHAILSDVDGLLPTGGGYIEGGKALTGVSWNNAGTKAVLDADDVIWNDATFICRYAIIYRAGTVGLVVDPLIKCFDLDMDRPIASGTFGLRFDSAGVLYID